LTSADTYSRGIAYTTITLSPVLVFAAFTGISLKDGEVLDSARLFTSLTLISLLASPLSHLFQSLPGITGAINCFDRIQTFLLAEPRNDYRLRNQGRATHLSMNSPFVLDAGTIPATFCEKYPKTCISPVASSATRNDMVVIENGSFAWALDGKPILHDINLRIKTAELTVIVGPVGSGKTTLIKAFLGEAIKTAGSVSLSSLEIALCEQTPWLINATLRQNVTEGHPFDEVWYRNVLYACALEQDIAQIPDEDEMLIGSKGVKLSGGQKQRVVSSYCLTNFARRSS
jgi:ATP-binding cassette, subfamily C (CFTR/MRP), member 1